MNKLRIIWSNALMRPLLKSFCYLFEYCLVNLSQFITNHNNVTMFVCVWQISLLIFVPRLSLGDYRIAIPSRYRNGFHLKLKWLFK